MRSSPATPARRRVGLAIAALLGACVPVEAPNDARREPTPIEHASPATAAPAHGYNDAIAWRTLDDGLATVKAGTAPMMLLVHASWCHRCAELKPVFGSEEVEHLSRHFVMVNVDQDEIPQALTYGPDGSYIPRVLFFDPATGAIDPAIDNPRRNRFRYYYGPRDDLIAAMKEALSRHERS